MATLESRPPIDPRLLSADGAERVNYGLEIYRPLVGSERFKQVLTTLGYNPLQERFVNETSKLILNGEELINDLAVIFRPENGHERIEGDRYARVYSPGKGILELTAHFPEDERIIEAGLVNRGVIKKDEAKALRPLFNGRKPFLRLVVMDPPIQDKNNLRPFVEATHADEPDLQPKTLLNSIKAVFKGNPLYEVSMYSGTVRVNRYKKWKVIETEEWVTIPPVEGEGFLLVGKKVNT